MTLENPLLQPSLSLIKGELNNGNQIPNTNKHLDHVDRGITVDASVNEFAFNFQDDGV